jgi:hypothetical protein
MRSTTNHVQAAPWGVRFIRWVSAELKISELEAADLLLELMVNQSEQFKQLYRRFKNCSS